MAEIPKAPFHYLKTWQAISSATFGFLVSLALYSVGQPGRATVTGAFLASLMMGLWSSSHLWRAAWYRITALALVLLHIAVVALSAWSQAANWSELTFVPFMAADLAFIFAVICLCFWAVHGRPGHLFVSDAPGYRE